MAALLAAMFSVACAKAPPSPPPNPAFAALGLRRIEVGPVAYATYQPNEPCSLFIDEDLRSTLVREVRRRGYLAATVGKSVPRTFASGSAEPLPGEPMPAGLLPSRVDGGVLLAWIDEYWENSLCGGEGPKYLTMEAVGILYAGTPPREVWRGRARAAEQGDYTARDLIWLTTSRLTDRLLETLPAGPGLGQPP
jgi:hypothetical protein